MKNSIWIVLMLLVSIKVPAWETKDTLETWMSKFYRLANPVLSENGKWAAVRKRYDIRQDTVLVINTSKPNIPLATLVLNGTVTFLKDDGLLVAGSNKAQFLDLRSGMVKHYDNVQSAYPLSELGQYAVLQRDAVLNVYTLAGQLRHQLAEIQGFPVTDNNKNLYVSRKINNSYEVDIISGKGLKKLTSIDQTVKEMQLSPSGKQLFVMGQENGTENYKITVVNTKDGSIVSVSTTSSGNQEFFKVTEIQEGKAYWIVLYSVQKPESGVVDIWYGNDENLDAKKTGSRKGRFWLWKPGSDNFEQLPNDVYPAMAPLNSERYFLAYHPTKGHNFLTYQPQFNDTSIYDAEKKVYRSLTSLKGVIYGIPEVICSKNGKYVVGSRDGQQWTLFNIEDGSQYDINRNGLQNPAFSDDNRYIFFESGNDLWKYDVVIKTLIPTKLAPGKTAKIVNVTEYEQSPQSHISVRSFDPKKTVLLEIRDPVQNLTSYNVWKENNTTKEIIPSTNDKIRNIVYDDRMSIFLTLEENYNKAPQLFLRSSAPKKQLLYGGDTADQTASLLKQDIIHYTSGEGLPLKGVLYYPVHYQPNKKYPMVVHIYQIQSDKSNEYFTPSYNNRDGLDIRTLTERGYFVLLPDTAVGPTGAGLSALHCVNKALDAVHTHPNIDMQKVGLVGHSFGGYETNFIATHSNRFAAYISGAGISDIVRSYFSYNYHFAGPYYWQYEHGIFSMLPFSNSKEIYFNNNPIYNIEGINAPILLWTGMKDQNVPWDQTMEFFIGLKRNQKPTIALFYPNGRHALAFDSKEKKNLHTKVLEWWDYFLKNKKNVPWIDRQMKKGA